MKYQNIIFDFGNVLSLFNADRLTDLCTSNYHGSMKKKRFFLGWNALNDGFISYENYIEEVQT